MKKLKKSCQEQFFQRDWLEVDLYFPENSKHQILQNSIFLKVQEFCIHMLKKFLNFWKIASHSISIDANYNFQNPLLVIPFHYHPAIHFSHDWASFSQFAFGFFWEMSLETSRMKFREKLLSHGKCASPAVRPTGRGVELSRYLPKNHVALCCDTVSQHAGALQIQGEKDVSSQTKHELSFPLPRKTEQLHRAACWNTIVIIDARAFSCTYTYNTRVVSGVYAHQWTEESRVHMGAILKKLKKYFCGLKKFYSLKNHEFFFFRDLLWSCVNFEVKNFNFL